MIHEPRFPPLMASTAKIDSTLPVATVEEAVIVDLVPVPGNHPGAVACAGVRRR